MSRIFVTRNLPGDALSELASRHEVVINDSDEPVSHERLVEEGKRSDALIVLLSDPVDEQVVASGVKCISTFAVGYDNIDTDAARRHGVAVCNTPDVLTDATADLAFSLLLAAARRIPESEVFLREGKFEGWAPSLFLGMPVAGRVLGVIGAGRIGRAMMARGAGFGMDVRYHQPNPLPSDLERGAIRQELDDLLAESDFVSLHVPLTDETHHLLDERRLGLMKPTAVLINTARGPVVDEAALSEALASGRLFSAGLDVFEKEPAVHPRLMELSNVVMTPHTGSATVTARAEMAKLCCDAVEAVLAGRSPSNAVVPPPSSS